MEANAVEISPPGPTELQPLADQWLDTARATNHRLGKPIVVRLEVVEDVPKICTLDARHVTQIVDNLTDNALKFTKQGRVTIAFNPVVEAGQTKAGQLDISVSDTGCGIP